MPNVVKIIVNADDLGITPEVNDAIFDLMGQGKVTSATMIANAPYIEDACRQIGRYGSCSFGVHLNIAEFKPLSEPEGIRQLLNEDGTFAGYDRVRHAARNSGLADAVFLEFCAQIEMCRSAGVEISHIDSHQHVHTIPWIFPILKRVQKTFNIHRVRISKNLFGPREPASPQLRLKKAAYNFLIRHYVKTATTGAFADFRTFYECATASVLNNKQIEAMVHPGSIDYDWSKEETDLLLTDWEDRLRFPIELINYNALPPR